MRGEGTWRLDRGATALPGGGSRFSVWAPRAQQVSVCSAVDGAVTDEAPLRSVGDGLFEGEWAAVSRGHDYFYRIDGRERPDPVSRFQPHGVHGPSRVVDPGDFAWGDDAWVGRKASDLVLYEIHVGTFSPAGTFEGAIPFLAGLRELGITAIELMPIAQFPGARNWGYDGVHPYAPQSTYGGPEGLRRLVDAAHRADLAVVLDVVYNHLGPEGNYLDEFGPYFTDSYRTPWGRAVNFDDADSDEVRRYFIDNALYWITEFHVDGLRLDAVHAIYDFGARHILEELAERVRAQSEALGRTALVIAESDLNDPRLVRSRDRGGYGLDAQWTDDFHHAIHGALTGERNGYYVDFGGVEPVAKALSDRFVYDGRRSVHRRRRHGAPAVDVPADRFVVFLQNHDQVGNRANGERLSCLVSLACQRLAAGALLLSPYVPLLFMGEEYGETSPFLYFVSHGDPDLVQAVREGRRREFASFGWQGEIPDPQAVETFERCRLDRGLAEKEGHRELAMLYRDLLVLRRNEPSLRPGSARCRVECDGKAGWVLQRLVASEGSTLAAALNFATTEQRVSLDSSGSENVGGWTRLLCTDDALYGGQGGGRIVERGDGTATLVVPPVAALVCRARGG